MDRDWIWLTYINPFSNGPNHSSPVIRGVLLTKTVEEVLNKHPETMPIDRLL